MRGLAQVEARFDKAEINRTPLVGELLCHAC